MLSTLPDDSSNFVSYDRFSILMVVIKAAKADDFGLSYFPYG